MSEETLLDGLLDRYEDARARGEAFAPDDGADPELLGEFHRRVQALENMHGRLIETRLHSALESTPGTGSAGRLPISAEQLDLHLVYRELRYHAQGGLGCVGRGFDAKLRRDVALKFVREHAAADPLQLARFHAEAEVTARLDHPGVVPVYGLGRTPDGQPFYAMRFVEGETMEEAIRRFHSSNEPNADRFTRHVMEFRALLNRFVAVCNTLAYAHIRGVVHLDVKPENIMLGRFGETIVLDWGLASPVARTDADRELGEATLIPSSGSQSGTSSGGGAGTPAYMSPEQARGDGVIDRASDVYGLGATLYKILTGKAPVRGHGVHDILRQVREGRIEPPRTLDRHIPPQLEAICLKAMAFDPRNRYASAQRLAEDFEHWLADEPVEALRDRLAGRFARWVRKHRGSTLSAALSLLVLVFGAVAAAVWMGRVAGRESRLHDRAVAAHSRERELRELTLRTSAVFAARSIANQIAVRWRILEHEAADPRLAEVVRRINGDPADVARHPPLQQWLEACCARHENEVPARAWHINLIDGTQAARWPMRDEAGNAVSSLGRRYAYRDYFHGKGQDYEDDPDANRAPMTQSVHVSTVLESTNDGRLSVVFSTPIRDPGSGASLAVIGMSVALGEFADLKVELPEGQAVLLVDTRQYYMRRNYPDPHQERGEGLILHHPELRDLKSRKRLPHLDDETLAEIREAIAPTAGERCDNLLQSEYRDPLATDTKGRWIAAFSPVVVQSRPEKLRHTGWVVIVQDIVRDADAPIKEPATEP